MQIVCLLRFGKKEYIENFVTKGEIRFSPLADFRGSNEKERADDLEGAISILNEEFTKVEFSHPTLGNGTLHFVPDKLARLTQYDDRCMGSFSSYALLGEVFDSDNNGVVDERMLEFGDYAAMIPAQHMKEFLPWKDLMAISVFAIAILKSEVK
jgi:hypothetical protein